MYLKSLELAGFKSFAKAQRLDFNSPISSIVGPNGSGKSNVAEGFRFVLGEQSMKTLRGKRGEDLIWNGGGSTSRANRASVKVVFDNSKRLLDIDFDEVTLQRVVHRDGTNQYFINDSQVRLKDMALLLASANIGSSGHHIISQGEADKILNINLKERREMIEDALGLKVYHYKKQESERKLTKTKENINQVQLLRKEIAPHVRFLKKQVEKVEKARTMRDELKSLYQEYLRREHDYISSERAKIKEEKREPETKLSSLEEQLREAKEVLASSSKSDEKSQLIITLEEKLSKIRKEKDDLSRQLGRLEGQITFAEKSAQKNKNEKIKNEGELVALTEVRATAEKIKNLVDEASEEENLLEIQLILKKVKTLLQEFLNPKVETDLSDDKEGEVDTDEGGEIDIHSLKQKQRILEEKVTSTVREEENVQGEYKNLRNDIETAKDESREAERAVFSIMSEQTELRSTLSALRSREEGISRSGRDFDEELKEGEILIGQAIHSFKTGEETQEIVAEAREVQEKRRKALEKLKIRLEEFGGGSGEEIEKEYKDVQERDEFLEREIEDLIQSAESLKGLIGDLEEKLRTQFKAGVEKINKAFQEFFALMFGGGAASLSVVQAKKRKRARSDDDDLDLIGESDMDEEDEEMEEGIEINVSLPRKKIKGLHMLSGGERALTSIALLFAMSQVNPPPFLVLDETDAALDEANSRRYGDMIEMLSKYSQLILITHNRETMSRAGILYGVTMGGDGVSKLLSVQFDEAVQIAK